MLESPPSAESLYELAKLHLGRCDFASAERYAKEAASLFFAGRSYPRFIECQNILLRICVERGNFEAISLIKESIQDLVLKENIELSSRTYYVLGICSRYREQYEAALEYFQKAVASALKKDNKEDLSFAMAGRAIIYFRTQRYGDALKEIADIKVLFDFVNVLEVKLSVEILTGSIYQALGRYEDALEVLWGCYDTLREEKNFYMYLHLLFAIGSTYRLMNDTELARLYFQLAQKSADPTSTTILCQEIQKNLRDLGVTAPDEYDLVYVPKTKSVLERRRGRIDFKNQFILLDLLHMFLRTPGDIYTKEQIAKMLWNQDYDPTIHDNKIYVTIKRLRKMIEPDFDKPRYIFRAKNGYYLNRSARIHIQQ